MQRFEARDIQADDKSARPRKLLRRGFALAAAVVLVSACSVIPPQEVNDPLGLHGEELEVTFTPVTDSGVSAAAELGAQAVAGSANGVFEFDDLDGSLPINPGTLTNDVGFASVRLTPATDAPDEITLTDAVLTINVWHGATAADGVTYPLEATGPITLKLGTCFGGSCTYSVDGDAPALGTVKLSGNPLRDLLDIAFNPPEPNHGSASLTVQADPDTLAGKTLTITLAAATGTVGF